PYNLQPHLKCLTDPDYDHKYYVDQRPRVFDVQIFADDSASSNIHPGGWGTILVGSMRFGGSPVTALDLNGVAADKRKFISAYFVLDITNPEAPPQLLAEMTMTTDDADSDGNLDYTDLGYTTSSPALVIMRDDAGRTEWYLTLGNGPTNLKGENTEQGKIAIMPLNWLVGEPTFVVQAGASALLGAVAVPDKPFRIPNAMPIFGVDAGFFPIPDAASGNVESFVSDIVSVDYDVNSPAVIGVGAAYKTDAIYFGTTDGSGFVDNGSGGKEWGGGGRMMRLVTRSAMLNDLDADGELFTDGVKDPGESYIQEMTKPYEWLIYPMLDAQGPVSTGPGVGWDGSNFWIYFGTGRFLDSDDKTDAQVQRFFGLKESYDCATEELSWDVINWLNADVAIDPDPTAASASRGLMRVDEILVVENEGTLFCADWTTDCRLDNTDTAIATFSNLKNYIVGETCPQENEDGGLDGWYRVLPDTRERNLGQATLLGGLVTFTTYRPYVDVCQAEGESFLYGVHYQTGTSWTKNLFGTTDVAGYTLVKSRIGLGKGLALTPSLHVGNGDDAATAFIQTSTGEIVEIGQEELPLTNFRTGRSSWRQE
ncbi:MAG: hypothetical protein PF495_01870, partial [Spirochaetales bacterium]|nr:hypothetical protein [Spirochaetales bacterium]